MSGMLGAIAIASVRATRQAEGWGMGTAGATASFSASFSLSFSASLDFPSPLGTKAGAAGAAAGRGFGDGTPAAACARPTGRSVSTATVTTAMLRQNAAREGLLRRPFLGLNFMQVSRKKLRQASGH